MKKPIGYLVYVDCHDNNVHLNYIGALIKRASKDERGILFMNGEAGSTLFSSRAEARKAIARSKTFFQDQAGHYYIWPVFKGEVP